MSQMPWKHYLPADRLRWKHGYDSTPIWPSDPDPTVLRLLAISVLGKIIGQSNSSLQVKFLADGARHKVYEVTHPSVETAYLLRVAIPLDPRFKMESEMATLETVRRTTSIPVPRPVAWSSSSGNELGYEWCLVEKAPGVELRNVWRAMPWDKKLEVVDRIAEIMAQLWGPALRYSKLGSIYLNAPGGNTLTRDHRQPENRITRTASIPHWEFNIGPAVDPAFFSDRRRYLKQDRGPYKSCHDWAKALIDMEVEYIKTARMLLISKPGIIAAYPEDNWDWIVRDEIGLDEDELEEFDKFMETCDAYLRFLPTVFPPKEEKDQDVARFSLYHGDLRSANVIVDPDTYKVTGIIDWEQSITVPHWYSRIYPDFLQGDDPFEGDGHRTPDTYDSDDENYNAVVVANRDRWDGRLLRARFDDRLEELGWKGWQDRSNEDEAKLAFLGGIADLGDWESAERQLQQALELLGISMEARHGAGIQSSSEDGEADIDGRSGRCVEAQ